MIAPNHEVRVLATDWYVKKHPKGWILKSGNSRMEASLHSTRQGAIAEAQKNIRFFGDGELYVERYEGRYL